MICYDFELNILRIDEDGEEDETSLPFSIRADDPLNPEQLAAAMLSYFNQFMELITGYDPSRADEYRWEGDYTGIAIYEC